MSVVRAGDIRQLTINGREFDAAPESSCNVRTGGFANEVARNGNGSIHVTQKRTNAGVTDLSLSIDDTRQDLEFLQEQADEGVPIPVTMTLASGIGYSGSLVVVAEDLGKATGEGTAQLSLLGERFEQI
jgi:hypothetical protein